MTLPEIQIRDPYIIKADGKYFMYGTTESDPWIGKGSGFLMYRSEDLINFDGPYEVFKPDKDFYGLDNFWAPEVHTYKGSFYMFASFRDQHGHRGTGILKSESPYGPFQPWSEGMVTPDDWMSLDGTLYVDESAKAYMVFCHEWVQIVDGSICAIELDDKLKTSVSRPLKLFNASEASWSVNIGPDRRGRRGHITDGCFLYRKTSGELLMLWSTIGTDGYCIGYARSDDGSLFGKWTQSDQAIYSGDGGHGMIFETYDHQLFLCIHHPNNTPNERCLFLEIVETEDGIALKSKE